MENKSYDEVNPEEIIIKLEEVLAFLKNKKLEANKKNEKEFTNTLIPRN